MVYHKISDVDLDYFKKIIGDSNVSSTTESLINNGHDHTESLNFRPEVVVWPKEVSEIQKLLSYCNRYKIAVTPRGAGTGLSGGSIPVKGGVSLDLKRLNKILSIDDQNFQVVTEPGVITQVLQEAVRAKGLFYPVDPASRGSCFIGGNVAENSGGPRAVKYGTVKDYVLNLEAVLPSGEIIHTGANTLKNATGYDLTRLIVGSEGTLAVVTKITLKLLAYPKERLLMLAPFTSQKNAIVAVNEIMKAGIMPSALEFMERDALLCVKKYLEESPVKIPENIQAHLLIEVDGQDREQLYQQVEEINKVLENWTDQEVLFADDSVQEEKLWKLRRMMGEAAKSSSVYKEEDTVVPRAYLPDLLTFVKQTGDEFGFKSLCYGHTGDGNLHVNILKNDLSDKYWKEEIPKALKKIFSFVHSKGGTISGEHGIGLVQKEFMPIVFNPTELNLMKSIKTVFDPCGILNPDKIFPE